MTPDTAATTWRFPRQADVLHESLAFFANTELLGTPAHRWSRGPSFQSVTDRRRSFVALVDHRSAELGDARGGPGFENDDASVGRVCLGRVQAVERGVEVTGLGP